MLYQLSYAHQTSDACLSAPSTPDRQSVRQEGLEPPSIGLEGRCSIHLSYCPVTRGNLISLNEAADVKQNARLWVIRLHGRGGCEELDIGSARGEQTFVPGLAESIWVRRGLVGHQT